MDSVYLELNEGDYRAACKLETAASGQTIVSAHHEGTSFRILSGEERRSLLHHLLEAEARESVTVTRSTQEVTFLLRDEVCCVWTFRIGFNVVHYIEPASDPSETSIRVEEFEKAEDLQLCLAAAIAMREQRAADLAERRRGSRG